MLHWLDYCVLALYLVALFGIGMYCRTLIKSQKDLFLGGRRFGKFMMAFQSFGIGTHSEQVVGVVGQCYKLGLAGIWWQFLWLFPTPIYWLSHPMLRRMRMVTSADFWAERYSPTLGRVAAVLGVFQVTFTIATMLKALGTVALSAVLAGDEFGRYTEEIVIVVCSVLFVFYGVAGGLYAATITDIIQGLLTIVLSLLLIPFILNEVGGMAALHDKLDPSMFSYTVPGEMTVFYIVMLSLNGLVGIYTGPHSMTNLGSGKTEWDVRVGSMAGTLLKRFCTVAWAFMGLGALALYTLAPGEEEKAFGLLIRDLLPAGLTGLMLAAILAAIMSTCDAMMLSGSALLTRNLYAQWVRDRGEAHYVRVGQVFSAVVVVFAALLAFAMEDVLTGLKQIWTCYAFMGLAWWGGVIWKRSTTAAAWVSTIVTVMVYVGTVIYNAKTPEPTQLAYPQQIAMYLGAGFAALVLTSLLTGHTNPDGVRRFYRKMRTPVTQASEFDADD